MITFKTVIIKLLFCALQLQHSIQPIFFSCLKHVGWLTEKAVLTWKVNERCVPV